MKDLFIAAHEELIERYLERHPEATEAEAYDATADRAYDHMVDAMADRMDRLRKERNERGPDDADYSPNLARFVMSKQLPPRDAD